jgi:hypothetical protein
MRTVNVSFNEEQRIEQWWLKLILLATLVVLIYAIIDFTRQETDITDQLIFGSSLILGFAAIALVWFWKLRTQIDNYGISVKCPFVNKKVAWNEIEHLEVLDYGFVGGWGIRIGTKYGTAYNTSGKIGMAIRLKNKKKFLVGTQKEQELKKIVEKWKNI